MRAGDAVRAAVALAVLAAATLAHADYKDSYARGVKAYRDGNFGEARTLIQQALSEHPEPAAKVRLYGQVYEPYVPQFYLGEIAFKQGDCAAALTQFNAAASKLSWRNCRICPARSSATARPARRKCRSPGRKKSRRSRRR